MPDLTDLEKELLLNMAEKIDTIDSWGAWVAACAEGLKGHGLVTGHYKITDAGRKLAEEIQWPQ